MEKEQIKEKILLEKNANLIDILEIASVVYAKALVSNEVENYKISYDYYKICENRVQDLTEEEKEEIKHFFEINTGNIVY